MFTWHTHWDHSLVVLRTWIPAYSLVLYTGSNQTQESYSEEHSAINVLTLVSSTLLQTIPVVVHGVSSRSVLHMKRVVILATGEEHTIITRRVCWCLRTHGPLIQQRSWHNPLVWGIRRNSFSEGDELMNLTDSSVWKHADCAQQKVFSPTGTRF